ncbi:MAG TPA: PIG-L deacetylase family protein [Acetobacteraceae bacterium]
MEALPLGALADIAGDRPVLVMAPHADDESLGCGGLIAALCRIGAPPVVLVLTDGAGSHPGSAAFPPARLAQIRQDEAREAVRLLGLPADRIHFAGHRDTAAPTGGPAFDAAAEQVSALCRTFGIGTLLAPWRHDPHCDHEAADLLARAVAGRLALRHLSYPVWGWTLPAEYPLPEMPDGLRLDIRHDLDAKTAAIMAHQTQYGGLITDDPTGFTLPAELLQVFARPYETFLDPGP